MAFIYPMSRGFFIRIGPFGCRYSFDRKSRFSNGRWWSSGWHRWQDSMGDC